ncbi:FMRFamide receptor-like isoform X1 [Mya arenaria]|uniref:FMRFamide receptor-like isoform X1 n=1 Tax=Mya arenaria TaxID=6604 RepID=UPI0022E3B37C|nr:FMRFamide receptor-like isoform X1 [Mya arenaria]
MENSSGDQHFNIVKGWNHTVKVSNMDCMQFDNATVLTGNERLLAETSQIIYGYVLPVVCCSGILGNLMNFAILTRRKLTKSFKRLEKAANYCLIALAISDLCFCLFAFPNSFLPSNDLFEEKGFLFYYRMYCSGILNIFILTSTWLTVTMSVERYLAICHPFKQTFYLTIKKTKTVIVCVYIFCVIFNIPVFWRYDVKMVSCNNGTELFYQPVQVMLGHSEMFENIYRILWAIIGNFAPLILLIGFNICLCRKIHKSFKFRQKFRTEEQQGQSDAGQTLTITLVVIVVMFLILVAPSEVVMHVGQIMHRADDATYKTIEIVLNFMQSINFSVNFVLYCIISPYFRRTLKYILFCKWYFTRRKKFYLEVSMKKVTFSHYSQRSSSCH